MGQDRVGPSSKIWASRNNSGLGRTNGSGLARAVFVYGRLRDLREPEVPGRANDGATTATDVVLEGEHQSGRAVCVDACESLFSIAKLCCVVFLCVVFLFFLPRMEVYLVFCILAELS